MAKTIDFSGPDLKTERAEHHIDQLKALFDAHIATNQEAVRSQGDDRGRERIIGSPLPRHTPTILGDVLHNLRAALDHAHCILIEANGHTVEARSYFPIMRDANNLQSAKGSMNGHKLEGHAPSDNVIACIFDEIQPYPGGNGADLVRLHILDIADKHMILLPSEQHTEVTRLQFEGIAFSNFRIVTPSGSGAFAGFVPENGSNNQVAFKICFGRGQPYEGKPILPVLWGLLGNVRETLSTLKRAGER